MGGQIRSSWNDLLCRAAADGAPWLIVPKSPSTSTEHRGVSFAELRDGTARVIGHLQQIGVTTDQRVVIIADNSAESCILLLGVLLSGAVVVPIAPPSVWSSIDRWAEDLWRISKECEPSVLLVSHRSVLRDRLLPRALRIFEFQDILRARAMHREPAISLAQTAVIQYTSGTIAHSRGVRLTHGNLLHSVEEIGRAFDASHNDVGVSWLPQFHDMGLIGALFFTFFWRMPLVLLTPQMFSLRPDAWLWAISRFGGTCSAAPNSAYQVCANRIPERRLRGLNLSPWRISFNGAELIHPETIERFTTRFRPYGYRSEAMFPVYGLAENTVAVTLPEYRQLPRVDVIARDALEYDGRACPTHPKSIGARVFVSVGRPLVGHELRIVEPSSFDILPERTVGEVQVRGPCRMLGYLGSDANSSITPDGWLSTGDRGYTMGEELVVIGRYKHIIKRYGRTLDCAVLENVLRPLPGIRGGVVAIFGVPDVIRGTEKLVVVAETSKRSEHERRTLLEVIHAELRARLMLVPDRVELVAPGTILRTSSGKVRHAATLMLLQEQDQG